MMGSTLLLDRSTWDLVKDANGNIALAQEPYALAQDAASAIKTFLGECYWDTTVGVDYSRILGQAPSVALMKAAFQEEAETVPDVSSAKVFIISFDDRSLTVQVQTTSAKTGQVSSATFTVVNPQGTG